MMFPAEILQNAARVIENYTRSQRKIVTAESCTGGMIAAALTEIAGASAVLERGFISYSNDAKTEVLGVLPELLATHGAVSAEVAEAMAQGALEFSLADVAVAVTGIAGPDGATATKPVGLVFIGIAERNGANFHCRYNFTGNRQNIRLQTTDEALRLLLTFGSD